MLIYVLLLQTPELRGVVEPLLMTSRTTNEERAEIIEKMNEDCYAGTRTKVLVTLTTVAAEGFNLQRVNNV